MFAQTISDIKTDMIIFLKCLIFLTSECCNYHRKKLWNCALACSVKLFLMFSPISTWGWKCTQTQIIKFLQSQTNTF